MKVWRSLSCVRLWLYGLDHTVHWIVQARIREWVAYPFSSGSSPPRNWTGVSCIAGGFFTNLSGKVGIVPQRRSNHGKKGLMRFHLHYWLSALLEWTCLFFFSSSFKTLFLTLFGFPGGSDGKALACNSGDSGLIHGLRRFPGEGNGNPLQYSCLENSMVGGAW